MEKKIEKKKSIWDNGVALTFLAMVLGTATFELSAFFTGLFSSGLFDTLASGNMMQTIVIAVMLGASIIGIKNEEHKAGIIKGLQSVNDWIAVYLSAVIKIAPVGVFFLMADSFGTYGAILLSSMVSLVGTFW